MTVNILFGLTGSVATVKWPQIVLNLLKISSDVRVKIVLTDSAKHFFEDVAKAYEPLSYEAASSLLWAAGSEIVEGEDKVQIFRDSDEYASYRGVKESTVLHIELRKWADVLLIAPLSANTLAKIANGLCDNLLTCVVRAWDPAKPMILCCAMNTAMWTHPLTAKQIKEVSSWASVSFVDPASKVLACGDSGTGALADVETIIQKVKEALTKDRPGASISGAAESGAGSA
jgi:phosphopantothenoylcysteine decarboxylase